MISKQFCWLLLFGLLIPMQMHIWSICFFFLLSFCQILTKILLLTFFIQVWFQRKTPGSFSSMTFCFFKLTIWKVPETAEKKPLIFIARVIGVKNVYKYQKTLSASASSRCLTATLSIKLKWIIWSSKLVKNSSTAIISLDFESGGPNYSWAAKTLYLHSAQRTY